MKVLLAAHMGVAWSPATGEPWEEAESCWRIAASGGLRCAIMVLSANVAVRSQVPQQAVGECLASGRGRRQRETSTPPGGGRDPSNILLSYCPALAGVHPLDGAPRLRQWADPRPIPLQLHTRQSLTSLPTQLPPEGPARLFRRGSDRTGLWSVCSVPGHRQTLKSLLPPLPAGSANASNESPADLANHRSQPPHRP